MYNVSDIDIMIYMQHATMLDLDIAWCIFFFETET